MSSEEAWYQVGPWEARFSRPDGTVIERTLYANRAEAAGNLGGRISWIRHNVAGEWVLTLHGPEGQTVTGDAVWEGIFLYERWLEMPGEDGIDVLPLAPESTIGWAPASQDQPSYSTRSIDPTRRT